MSQRAAAGAILCVEIRPLLSRFVERETDPRETLRTSMHLDSCAGCRLRAGRLGDVMTACDDIDTVEPPADVASRVMDALRSMKAAATSNVDIRASKWSGLGVLLAVGAAMLARRYDVAEKAAIPVRLLARGIIRGLGAADAVEAYLSSVAPSLMRFLNPDVGSSVSSAPAPDLLVMAHIGGVVLLLALMLAIPVAAVTAWMLHSSKS